MIDIFDEAVVFATFSSPPLASTLSGLTGDSQGLRLRQTYLKGEPVFVNLIFFVEIRGRD